MRASKFHSLTWLGACPKQSGGNRQRNVSWLLASVRADQNLPVESTFQMGRYLTGAYM